MTVKRTFPKLRNALALESWEFLQNSAPEIAEALAAEIQPGVDPAEIRRFVMQFTGRDGIAQRIGQAAEWLVGERGE